jgi:LSD1 subclass zinc finger protein
MLVYLNFGDITLCFLSKKSISKSLRSFFDWIAGSILDLFIMMSKTLIKLVVIDYSSCQISTDSQAARYQFLTLIPSSSVSDPSLAHMCPSWAQWMAHLSAFVGRCLGRTHLFRPSGTIKVRCARCHGIAQDRTGRRTTFAIDPLLSSTWLAAEPQLHRTLSLVLSQISVWLFWWTSLNHVSACLTVRYPEFVVVFLPHREGSSLFQLFRLRFLRKRNTRNADYSSPMVWCESSNSH